jgi:hypothetical protein
MITNRFSVTWAEENGETITRTISRTYPGTIKKDVTVNNGVTHQLTPLTLATADMKGLIISSDRAVTLKTNSSGSPAQTFTIEAGIPLFWFENAPWSNPFTTNVTAFYFTNASGAQANIAIRFLTAS